MNPILHAGNRCIATMCEEISEVLRQIGKELSSLVDKIIELVKNVFSPLPQEVVQHRIGIPPPPQEIELVKSEFFPLSQKAIQYKIDTSSSASKPSVDVITLSGCAYPSYMEEEEWGKLKALGIRYEKADAGKITTRDAILRVYVPTDKFHYNVEQSLGTGNFPSDIYKIHILSKDKQKVVDIIIKMGPQASNKIYWQRVE